MSMNLIAIGVDRRTQTFTIPGRPNCNHRPRSMPSLEIERVKKEDKRGHMRETRNKVIITAKTTPYMDNDYSKYKDLVTQCAKEAGIEIYERCHMTVRLHLPMNCTKLKTKQNTVSERLDRGDLDNLKAIKDGLNGVAYVDDKHVMDGPPQIVHGIPGSLWRVEVIIREMHWTDTISDEAVKWCKDNNVKIPYPEERIDG